MLTIIIIFLTAITNNAAVFINSSQMLNEQLQNMSKYQNGSNFLLELDSTLEYQLSEGNFTCITHANVTIKSNDALHSASIFCAKNKSILHPTRGLAFVDSTVTILHINFISCGTNLTLSLVNDFNRGFGHLRYFTGNAAALLLVNCTVHMNRVMMESSFGFAIIGRNLLSSRFQILTIYNPHLPKTFNDIHHTNAGSGMLLHFITSNKTNDRNILMINSTFENNTCRSYRRNCIKSDFSDIGKILYYAAGLTILYTQINYDAHVTINHTTFTSNIGSYTGAMLIINLSMLKSTTRLSNSVFRLNAFAEKHCSGADIRLYLDSNFRKPNSPATAIAIEKCFFYGGTVNISNLHVQGSIHVRINSNNDMEKINLNFTNLFFTQYSISDMDGTCLSILMLSKTSSVYVKMAHITAVHNSNQYRIPLSLFYFLNIKNIAFSGAGNFSGNHGSVIKAEDTNIFLYDSMIFSNNKAESGAGIRLEGNGLVYFMPRLTAIFRDNRAYFSGGAIYINSNSYRECGIQMQLDDRQGTNVTFMSNLAQTAGNSVFAIPITDCESHNDYRGNWYKPYNSYFHFSSHINSTINSLLHLSTKPYSVIVYYNGISCSIRFRSERLKAFPGEVLSFKITSKDLNNRYVYSIVNVEILEYSD